MRQPVFKPESTSLCSFARGTTNFVSHGKLRFNNYTRELSLSSPGICISFSL